jgi:hypothetical protein
MVVDTKSGKSLLLNHNGWQYLEHDRTTNRVCYQLCAECTRQSGHNGKVVIICHHSQSKLLLAIVSLRIVSYTAAVESKSLHHV